MLVTFLPLRISDDFFRRDQHLTELVGEAERFGAGLAAIRATLFSKPEYVWMMYQLMPFGDRGCVAVDTGSGSGSVFRSTGSARELGLGAKSNWASPQEPDPRRARRQLIDQFGCASRRGIR